MATILLTWERPWPRSSPIPNGRVTEHNTNQEIRRELFIAPGTVKKNTVWLYDKLNVLGRRDAVAQALGYLPG